MEPFSNSNIIMVFIMIILFLWHQNLFFIHLLNMFYCVPTIFPALCWALPILLMCLFSSPVFFLISLTKRMSILLIFFKEWPSNFIDILGIFWQYFLFFISLISILISLMSFFLLAVGLVGTSLSSVLIWKVRLSFWDLSFLLLEAFTAINFLLKTPLTASH